MDTTINQNLTTLQSFSGNHIECWVDQDGDLHIEDIDSETSTPIVIHKDSITDLLAMLKTTIKQI